MSETATADRPGGAMTAAAGPDPEGTERRRRLKALLPAYLLSTPALVLYLCMLGVPLLLTALLSFRVFDWNAGIQDAYTLANWAEVLSDSYFYEIFGRTFALGLSVTFLCVLIGVPEAYILSRMGKPWRSIFLVVVLGPLLISVVVRTLGWALLIGGAGVVSEALQALGLTDGPVNLMFSMTGMIVALVHVMVPFMVISVWASIQKLDPAVEQAGQSLGASHFTALRRVVLPQIMPGILSGSMIVFALTVSAFATPAIIGGRRLKVVATAAYDEFLNTLNWPLGAALAVLLLVANVVLIWSYNRFIERKYAQVFG